MMKPNTRKIRKQQILSILLALALSTAATGCSGASSTPPAAPSSASSAASTDASLPSSASAEPVEITAVLQLNPEIVLENNPIVQAIEEDLNVRLNIEAPPQSSYGDRVKMLVGTGDIPDLIHYGADVFATQWAEEGLILDVTDKIAQYPNLSANISQEQYGDCVFLADGRIYGIPRPNSYDKWGYLINQTWLDRLGLQAPKTVDEYIAVCKAFTTGDPDGNGQNDTYGASLNANATSISSGIWHLQNDYLSTAYGFSNWHGGMPDSDGVTRLKPLSSGYSDYLQLLRQIYEEGIIDREFVTHKADESSEKFAQGRVGIVGASEKSYITNVIEKYGLNLDDYTYCPPLVRKEGDKPVYAMPPSNWMAYYISAKASPEKQDAVLRVLDWANTEKGFVMMQMGVAGTDYNTYDIETRTVDRTTDQLQNLSKTTSGMFAMANAYRDKPALQGGSTPEAIAKWQKEAAAADAATRKCYLGFTKMLDKLGVEFPDETQSLNTLEVRFVTGEVGLTDLMDYVDGPYREKTATIAQELEAYFKENPARYED